MRKIFYVLAIVIAAVAVGAIAYFGFIGTIATPVPPGQNLNLPVNEPPNTNAGTSNAAATDPKVDAFLSYWSEAARFNGEPVAAYRFPNSYDNGADDSNPNVPADYGHWLSIPAPSGKTILRVYVHTDAENLSGNEIRLVAYYPETKTADYLGYVKEIFGANAGGLFVPLAFTPDGKNIILEPWMDSPGAGGGAICYGYALIPFDPTQPIAIETTNAFKSLNIIAGCEGKFYAAYAKVVYPDVGDLAALNIQPGTQTYGAVVYRDLLTGTKKTLATAPDTGYEIASLDEAKRELKLTATKFIFTKECPRAEGALTCARQTTSTQTITLP